VFGRIVGEVPGRGVGARTEARGRHFIDGNGLDSVLSVEWTALALGIRRRHAVAGVADRLRTVARVWAHRRWWRPKLGGLRFLVVLRVSGFITGQEQVAAGAEHENERDHHDRALLLLARLQSSLKSVALVDLDVDLRARDAEHRARRQRRLREGH